MSNASCHKEDMNGYDDSYLSEIRTLLSDMPFCNRSGLRDATFVNEVSFYSKAYALSTVRVNLPMCFEVHYRSTCKNSI